MSAFQDRLVLSTSEGIELELTLAGLGSRFTAGLIDQMIKLATVGLLALAAVGVLGIAALIPAAALVWPGYDVAWEVLAQGRISGKRWMGVRVVLVDGQPVDLRASLVRNLLRLVDGYPMAYLPTIVLILATRRNPRLGDPSRTPRWCGTGEPPTRQLPHGGWGPRRRHPSGTSAR